MKWTYEACLEESLKYTNYTEFRKKSHSCYQMVHRNGWVEDICKHLIKDRVAPNYWDKDTCKEEANKYSLKMDFRNNAPTAYSKSEREGWLSEFFPDYIRPATRETIWNKEKCLEQALKYKTRGEFQKNCAYAYNLSWKNGWINDICTHMEICGSLHKRFIYAYEFSDNCVYVGLTYNIDKRKYDHLIRGSVFDYCVKSGLVPIFKQLISKPVDVDKAQELEFYYLDNYIKDGWQPLNRNKTGGLGANFRKWCYETIKEEVLKHNTKTDFRKNSSFAYVTAYKKGWLEEICSHMIKRKGNSKKYTLEKCIELAEMCETITDFINKYKPFYQAILRNGWRDEVFKNKKLYDNTYWTKEKMIEEVKKYNNKRELCLNNQTVYNKIVKNNQMEELSVYFKHKLDVYKDDDEIKLY